MKDKIAVELTKQEFDIILTSIKHTLDKRLDDIKREEKEKRDETINTFQAIKDKFVEAYAREIGE